MTTRLTLEVGSTEVAGVAKAEEAGATAAAVSAIMSSTGSVRSLRPALAEGARSASAPRLAMALEGKATTLSEGSERCCATMRLL